MDILTTVATPEEIAFYVNLAGNKRTNDVILRGVNHIPVIGESTTVESERVIRFDEHINGRNITSS